MHQWFHVNLKSVPSFWGLFLMLGAWGSENHDTTYVHWRDSFLDQHLQLCVGILGQESKLGKT